MENVDSKKLTLVKWGVGIRTNFIVSSTVKAQKYLQILTTLIYFNLTKNYSNSFKTFLILFLILIWSVFLKILTLDCKKTLNLNNQPFYHIIAQIVRFNLQRVVIIFNMFCWIAFKNRVQIVHICLKEKSS